MLIIIMADTQIKPANTNHYLQHLTELNNTQPVTASEDIYNQFGVLLIAKGSRINAQVQHQLLQHQLKKDIDDQVALEKTLSDEQIYQQIQLTLKDSADLVQMQQRNGFEDLFRHICLTANLPLKIRQKLSVISHQLPELFTHCQFNGWASALIAKEMQLSTQACQEAYTCGLIHDIGLLHLAAEVRTQTPLSEENWRALQSHVVIGQRCADSSDLPKSIGLGILEHHERFDQTGYPTRKSPEKLTLLGQIVASADLLHNLRTNELGHTDGSLLGALPYFKVHQGSFDKQIFSALMKILHRATLEQAEAETQSPPVNLERVRSISAQLQTLLAPLEELRLNKVLTTAPKGQKVVTMMASIKALMENSGINDPQLRDWLLSDVDPANAENSRCLIEIDVMQYELLWLVKRLGWNLTEFLNEAVSEPLKHYLQQLNTSVEEAFNHYKETALPASDAHNQD